MSQVYVPSTSSSPSIPTEFMANSGSAVPEANILKIVGTTGITTSGDGNTITISPVESGYTGTGTTVDNQIVNILVVPATEDKAFMAECHIVGYDSSNNLAIGGEIIAVGINDGAVAIVGSPEITKIADAPISSASFTVISLGTNFAVQATGVVGHTIDWRCTALVTTSP